MIVAGAAAGADGEGLAPVGAAGAGLVPLRWADAAVVVVVSEPTRGVSLALDGAEPVAVGAALVPAGAVRRRWADRCRSPLGPNRCRSPSPLRSSASREGAAVGRLPSERAAPSGRG